MAQTLYIPLGRLPDLQNHPNADRMAAQAGRGTFSDYTVKTWSNRAAMLVACRMSDTGELGARPWRPIKREG